MLKKILLNILSNVFQDGGRTYRAYLEGRVQGGAYLLLLHLTNLELKPLPGEA
jgi:hypothetical protein